MTSTLESMPNEVLLQILRFDGTPELETTKAVLSMTGVSRRLTPVAQTVLYQDVTLSNEQQAKRYFSRALDPLNQSLCQSWLRQFSHCRSITVCTRAEEVGHMLTELLQESDCHQEQVGSSGGAESHEGTETAMEKVVRAGSEDVGGKHLYKTLSPILPKTWTFTEAAFLKDDRTEPNSSASHPLLPLLGTHTEPIEVFIRVPLSVPHRLDYAFNSARKTFVSMMRANPGANASVRYYPKQLTATQVRPTTVYPPPASSVLPSPLLADGGSQSKTSLSCIFSQKLYYIYPTNLIISLLEASTETTQIHGYDLHYMVEMVDDGDPMERLVSETNGVWGLEGHNRVRYLSTP